MVSPTEPADAAGRAADPAPPGSGGVAGPAGADPEGRVARTRRRATDAARRAVEVAEGARTRSRLVDLMWSTGERDRRAVGSVLAGAVAFRVFVYLLPLVLAVLTLLGILTGLDNDTATEVSQGLGLGAYVVDSIDTASEQAHRSLWILVPLSLWAVYTAGAAAARVLHAVHVLAWDLPRARRPSSAARAAGAFALAVGALASMGLMQWARAYSPGLGLGTALLGVVPFAVLWFAASWVLPHDRRAPWIALVPGALLVGTGVWLIHLVSVYFLARRVDKASELYGSLGVAATLLAWLYLIGRLMVASAMLNATLWAHRGRLPWVRGDVTPGRSDPSG